MYAILIFVLLALLFKTPLRLPGDFYTVLLVEGMAGLYAVYFIVRHGGEVKLTRYWLFLAYLGVLWLSALSSANAAWVSAQAMALTSVVIFFIVFVEGYPDVQAVQRRVFVVFAAAIALTGVASVIYLKVFGIAAMDTSVQPWRYKGLFPSSADIGAASGLLVVISAFSNWPLLLRLSGGAIGFLNLWLSGSRNALAAAVAAMVVTPLVCGKKRWLILLGGSFASLASLYLVLAADLPLPPAVARTLRFESLETMSGRTDLWSLGFQQFLEKPWLGYGFTRGADAYAPFRARILEQVGNTSPVLGRHPVVDGGYIQSLLDAGIIGSVFYVAIILAAIYNAARIGAKPDAPPILACILFLAVANFAETIIFSAIKIQSVFFWYLALVSARLSRTSGIAAAATAGSARQAVTAPKRPGIVTVQK
jgi:O-antigen ligase